MLEEGQVRHGVIRSVKDFGDAVVDIGGVDGLLHVGEMSWNRVSNAGRSRQGRPGVEVKILKIDRQSKKVSLGPQAAHPQPWDRVEENYSAEW